MAHFAFLPSRRIAGVLLGLALLSRTGHALEGSDLRFGAAGWMQYGQIVNSGLVIDGNSLDRRSQLTSGAQFALEMRGTEKLLINAGVGAIASHFVRGKVENKGKGESDGGYVPMNVFPYLADGHFTYSFREEEGSRMFLRGGWFPYDYIPEAQNLGLYLLRGPVFPGFLISGFETKYVLPVANTLGLQFHHQSGGFEQDVLFTFDTEFYPYYDMSPAYVAAYRFGPALRIGAGVNFYHLIPLDKDLTSDPKLVYVDTAGGANDSIAIPFSGAKFMFNFALDPKAFLGGGESLGSEDLKLYGEVGLIGPFSTRMEGGFFKIGQGAAYKKVYGDIVHRMPVMAGFNLPAFKLLDRLALEVEWYGARYPDDLSQFSHTAGTIHTPLPPVDLLDANVAEDNWKWSLYGSKTIQDHIKVSLQAASDHFRPGIFTGYGDNNPPGSQAVLRSPKEWYWMTKVAYFF